VEAAELLALEEVVASVAALVLVLAFAFTTTYGRGMSVSSVGNLIR
jgi:hypothetical protein